MVSPAPEYRFFYTLLRPEKADRRPCIERGSSTQHNILHQRTQSTCGHLKQPGAAETEHRNTLGKSPSVIGGALPQSVRELPERQSRKGKGTPIVRSRQPPREEREAAHLGILTAMGRHHLGFTAKKNLRPASSSPHHLLRASTLRARGSRQLLLLLITTSLSLLMKPMRSDWRPRRPPEERRPRQQQEEGGAPPRHRDHRPSRGCSPERRRAEAQQQHCLRPSSPASAALSGSLPQRQPQHLFLLPRCPGNGLPRSSACPTRGLRMTPSSPRKGAHER